MRCADGRSIRTKKPPLGDVELLEDRCLLSGVGASSLTAPFSQTDATISSSASLGRSGEVRSSLVDTSALNGSESPVSIVTVPAHGDASRSNDARESISSPGGDLRTSGTLHASSSSLDSGFEDTIVPDRRRGVSVEGKLDESLTRDDESLFRTTSEASSDDGDASSGAKQVAAQVTGDDHGASIVASRLPEESKNLFVQEGESVSSVGQASTDGVLGAAATSIVVKGGPANGGDSVVAIVADRPYPHLSQQGEQFEGRLWEGGAGSSQVSGEEPVPLAREADLVAGFCPLDRAGLERAIDQLLGQLRGLEVNLARWGPWTHLILGLVGTAAVTVVAEVVRRRLRNGWDNADPTPQGEVPTWLPGLPGVSPYWSMEER